MENSTDMGPDASTLISETTIISDTTLQEDMGGNYTIAEAERRWETTFMVFLPLTITITVLITILLIVKTKMRDFASRLLLQFNIAIVLTCVFLLVAHEHNLTLYRTNTAYHAYQVGRMATLVGVVSYFTMAAYFALAASMCVIVVVVRDSLLHTRKHDSVASVIIWVLPLLQVLVTVLEATVFKKDDDEEPEYHEVGYNIVVAYVMILISMLVSIVKAFHLLILRLSKVQGTNFQKACSVLMAVISVLMFLRLLAFATCVLVLSDLAEKYYDIPDALVLIERIEVLFLVILLFCLKPSHPKKTVRAGKTYTRTEGQEKPAEPSAVQLQLIQE